MYSIIKTLLSLFIFMTISLTSQAEVVLHDTLGQNTLFSSLKGKWVLINYWAGWCQTCIDEIPEFNRFYQDHKKDPIAVYGVNYDALPLVEQKILIKKFKINYPNLLQNPATELGLEDIIGVPVTFIFNPKGQLVKTLYGGQTAEALNRIVAQN